MIPWEPCPCGQPSWVVFQSQATGLTLPQCLDCYHRALRRSIEEALENPHPAVQFSARASYATFLLQTGQRADPLPRST